MNADRAYFLLDQMLWNTALIAAPLLLAILITGVIISILQVATQIQEMTLTFVPKLIVAALLLVLLGSWMLGHLTSYAMNLLIAIPDLVG